MSFSSSTSSEYDSGPTRAQNGVIRDCVRMLSLLVLFLLLVLHVVTIRIRIRKAQNGVTHGFNRGFAHHPCGRVDVRE